MGMYTMQVLLVYKGHMHVRLLNERKKHNARIVVEVLICTALVPDKCCSNHTVNMDSNNK